LRSATNPISPLYIQGGKAIHNSTQHIRLTNTGIQNYKEICAAADITSVMIILQIFNLTDLT